MELKLTEKLRLNQKVCVLIGPSWNWNLTKTVKIIVNFLGFNRTFMELKRREVSRKSFDIVVLIGPSWNWNVFWSSRGWDIIKVLIGHSWNWNKFFLIFFVLVLWVLIGPSWNWNGCQVRIKCQQHARFNRTFMELKLKLTCLKKMKRMF